VSRRLAVALGVAAAAAAAVAVPLLVTGGGGGRLTKAEYSRSVTAIFTEVGDRFRAARPVRNFEETSASLRAMKAALDRATGRLRALDPPADVEREQRMLVSATHDYAAQVDLVRASVDFGDPATIAMHLREVTAPGIIQRTIRGLNGRGYRIPVTVVSLH
jgi:hypothetical protein